MTAAEPCLQEWAGGREYEVGQANAGQQKPEDVAGRLGVAHGLPLFTGSDRQEADCEGQQGQMEEHLLPWTEPRDAAVGVGVAREEHHLKEEHASRPDGGSATEPRQNEPRDERLDEEEQERAPEDGKAEGKHG